MLVLPLTLFLVSNYRPTTAGNVSFNDPCLIENNRLQTGTYQFYGDCNTHHFCDPDTKKCLPKKCRKDDFPFGYTDPATFPDKCDRGQFCPDEMDKCQPWLKVGDECQKNRDDQCEGPPNFQELRDETGRGLNFNGSVCLNTRCFWANVTENEPCELDNTAYIGYSVGGEFIDIVSRGNCRVGLYCDAGQRKCMVNKPFGAACAADKECDSWNCLSEGTCGIGSDQPRHFATWVYAVVGIAIIAGMLGTLGGLYLFHRKNRDKEREKRMQYWKEQNAFHQNLLQMRDTARGSIQGMPRDEGAYTDESRAPLTQYAQQPSRGSGLKYSDDNSSDGGSIYQHVQETHQQNRF